MKRPDDPLDQWPDFMLQVRAKLETGRAIYGDRSFELQGYELLTEIAAELEDVAGWAFILWTRIERVRRALESTEVHQ